MILNFNERYYEAHRLRCGDFLCQSVKDAEKVAESIVKAMGISPQTGNGNNKDNNAEDTKTQAPDASSEFNNIIVFTGDRGTGKSTVMRTFIKRNEPDEKRVESDKCEEKVYADSNTFKKHNAFILPIIDPTTFAANERLVGAVVSEIFNAVRERIEDDKAPSPDTTKTRKVMECCDKVHAALRILYTGVKIAVAEESDSLEALAKLTSTTRLIHELGNLFEAFMQWGNYGLIVIPIDDLDMQVKGNFSLLEEVRNFLFRRKIIVVMSVKVEQLADTLEQYFKKKLTGLPQAPDSLDAQPAEMASKYLQKLIPTSRRIALRTLRADMISSYEVKLKPDKDGTNPKLVDEFFKLVWRKTGIVLVKEENGSHGLIPLNLRALHHTFDMLNEMKDVFHAKEGDSCDTALINLCDDDELFWKSKKSEEDWKKGYEEKHKRLEDNLDRLENWALDSVCTNAVTRGLARIAREFAEHPAYRLHAFLVKSLDDYSAKADVKCCDGKQVFSTGLFCGDAIIKDMLAPNTLPENISIGDGLYAINKLEQLNPQEGFHHFKAVIKLLYSIKMIRASYLHFISKAKQDEDLFKPLRELINGLVYNPRLRLTYESVEWKTNVEVDCSGNDYPWSEGKKPDTRNGKNKQKNINDERTEKRTKAIAWCQMFFVGEGRVMSRNIHSIVQAHPMARQPSVYTKTRLRKYGHTSRTHASYNFMAIIYNLLYRHEDFYKRIKEAFPEGCGKEYIEELFKYQCSMFRLFSLSSAEVLDSVIQVMHDEADTRDDEHGIQEYRGANSFFGALSKALETAYKHTILREEDKEKSNIWRSSIEIIKKIGLLQPNKRGDDAFRFEKKDLAEVWPHQQA